MFCRPCWFVHILEFGVHLAELTVDPQGALAIRQVSRKESGGNKCRYVQQTPLFMYFLIIIQFLFPVFVLAMCVLTNIRLVTVWLAVFAVGISHPEAVCGDSLVFPVREVQASWNNRSGKLFLYALYDWLVSSNPCLKRANTYLCRGLKIALNFISFKCDEAWRCEEKLSVVCYGWL